MTYRGHIKDGVVVLDEPAKLPEGAAVRVEAVTPDSDRPYANKFASPGEPTLVDEFREFIGIAPDLPPDMAENHDHYLYGTPKRPRIP